MPLSKAKQAEYQKERRLKLKGVIPSVIPSTPRVSVIPKLANAGLKIEGNRIVGLTKVIKQPGEERLPVYNPAIHKPGDKVLIQRGKQWMPYLVPDLDAGGQSIPDFTGDI